MYEAEDDDQIKEITDNLREARNHWSKWRNTARESYDFFAGVQWSEDDVRILEEQGRPSVTFNRIARTINAVAGLELQNRQEVSYSPRTIDDSGVNEVLTAAAKWVRDNCDAEDEESEAFQDALITGQGWTETRLDFAQNAEGMVQVSRVDPFEMAVDPNAKKRNFDDAKWVARIKELTRNEYMEFLKQIGVKDDGMAPAMFWNDSSDEPHDATSAYLYQNDQGDKLGRAKTYSVVQYQWFEQENVYQVADQNGQIVKLPKERFDKMKPMIEAQGLRYGKTTQRKYKQMFLCGNKELVTEDAPCQTGFSFRAITGLRDRNRNTWFGIVDLMKDPQRWANKWLSQIQYIVNSGAKNGLIAESDAISNPRKFEEDYAKPGSISMVNPGAISQGKIKDKATPQYPDGVDRLLQYALTSINDVPGVNLEMIGQSDRNQPYALEETRKQAGITILASFFDALRRYRKEQGRVLAYFITEYIADGRLIRIVGDMGAKYVPLLKDDLTLEYDVVVGDAPNSPNMKERVFHVLNQIIPMALQAGIAVPPDVLDYAPIPEALAQKWKQSLQPQQDPMAEQMKQLQMMAAQLELEGKQIDNQYKQVQSQEVASRIPLNAAKAEQAYNTGQDEAAQAANKMGLESAQYQMKEQQLMQEQARKDVELLLNQRRKMLEAKMNAQIKQQQIK